MNHNHSQDNGNMDDGEQMDVIVLTDDEGNELEFEVVDKITVANRNYILLTPLDDDDYDDDEEADDDEEDYDEDDDEGFDADEDDDEEEAMPLLILRVEREGDEEYFVDIEDPEEFERVVQFWEARQ